MEVTSNMIENLIPIALFLGAFALIFGIRYLSNKEKMAMIERGMDISIRPRPAIAPKPFWSLKFGLLMVGLGIGLIAALFIAKMTNLTEEESVALYFGFLAICGGAGLIVSYVIEKSWLDKHPN